MLDGYYVTMKYVVWAFLLFALLSLSEHSDAQTGGYTLDDAPWSDESYDVCSVENENGLRPVIFEPEIKVWKYEEKDIPIARLRVSKNDVYEEIVESEPIRRTAYYLKKQKIGYLDSNNLWVTESGLPIETQEDFETYSGERVTPEKTENYGVVVYKTNVELELAATIEKIHYDPVCTVYNLRHVDKMEFEDYFDFGQNNPFVCDNNGGKIRSTKFNYTEKSYRGILTLVDGSSIIAKYPNGQVKTYPWFGFEFLYNKDGSLICDWNFQDINGYELIHRNE